MSLIYSEASYFDGYHYAHIACWLEHKLDQHRAKSFIKRHHLLKRNKSLRS